MPCQTTASPLLHPLPPALPSPRDQGVTPCAGTARLLSDAEDEETPEEEEEDGGDACADTACLPTVASAEPAAAPAVAPSAA